MTEERVLVETAFGVKLAVNLFADHRYYSNGTNSSETSNTMVFFRVLPHVDYVVDVGADLVSRSFPFVDLS